MKEIGGRLKDWTRCLVKWEGQELDQDGDEKKWAEDKDSALNWKWKPFPGKGSSRNRKSGSTCGRNFEW